MIKSSLAIEVYEAHVNNYEKGRRGYKICKFTPHIMAGILTARQCGVNVFQKANRYASANYGIGNDGEIACYVGEENRSYASYSASNDCQAVTVEVSNCEIGGEWRISEKAWNSLVKLAVDVCRRNGFRLVYDGTPNGSLTRHNMFINTTCPGPYLQSRFQELADTVNAILDGQAPAESGQNTAKSPAESGQTTGKIATIQSTLNKRYGFNIAVDNIYGNETKTALVKGLQTELNKQFNKGLVVDGIFGNLTKNACVVVEKGDEGNITYLIQAMLICKGYDLEADGIFGSITDSKVKEFQKNNNLEVDGLCGKNTFEKLFA